MLHGEFELDAEEIARARAKLDFCRVEVVGLGPRASNAEPPRRAARRPTSARPKRRRRRGSSTAPSRSRRRRAPSKLRVTLPDNLGLVPGQPLRLARQRFDAVFPVPAGAVGGADDHRSVWIAGATGTAERREVAVADAATTRWSATACASATR